jgi:hypothetical protein
MAYKMAYKEMAAPVARAPGKNIAAVSQSAGSPVIIWLLAVAAIFVYGLAALTSSWDDSPAFDETEHVTSGFLCLASQNFRVNPWHPPLAKILAAAPLVVAQVRPPAAVAGREITNQQISHDFFFAVGNNPQSMIRLARMPMIAASMVFLAIFFWLNSRCFGPLSGLFSVLLLSSSPTFLAHSRFVGNDVLAAAAFFVSISLFVDFLGRRSFGGFLLLTLVTAVSQLVKFSLITLYPFFAIVCFCQSVRQLSGSKTVSAALRTGAALLSDWALVAFMYVGGLALVAIVYQWHVANLPIDFQTWYNDFAFQRFDAVDVGAALNLIAADEKLRGISWYLTGLAAQSLHVQNGFGMESYLLGKWYRGGNSIYFPLVLCIKESLPFLMLLTLAAGAFLLRAFSGKTAVSDSGWRGQRQSLFAATSFLFVLLYMLLSIKSGLNIGVRHVLPILPFVTALAGAQLAASAKDSSGRTTAFGAAATVLLIAACICVHASWPGYLSYYNELVGGKRGGPRVAVDSNCDWGTDLLRLKRFVDRHQLAKIELLYFGKGDPQAYLGCKYIPFAVENQLKPGEWIAVSVTYWRRIQSAFKSKETSIYLSLQPNGQSEPVSVASLEWMSRLSEQEVVGDSLILFKQP